MTDRVGNKVVPMSLPALMVPLLALLINSLFVLVPVLLQHTVPGIANIYHQCQFNKSKLSLSLKCSSDSLISKGTKMNLKSKSKHFISIVHEKTGLSWNLIYHCKRLWSAQFGVQCTTATHWRSNSISTANLLLGKFLHWRIKIDSACI